MEKNLNPYYIRFNEKVRLVKAPVHVRFGGKVNDGFHPPLQESLHQLPIANISLYKLVTAVGGEACDVLQVSGISQFIKIQDLVIIFVGALRS